MEFPNIVVDPNLNGIMAYLAVFAAGVNSRIEDNALNNELNELIKFTKKTILLEKLLENYNAKEVRSVFKKIKLDPTKYRPSSEALFRRCHKDEFIPFINTIVAICNYCSLKYLIPIGCYDLDKIGKKLVIKKGNEDDRFFSLRSTQFFANGRIIISDENGAFGSPIIDSIRASVTEKSKNIALIYYIPASIPNSFYKEASQLTVNMLNKYASPDKIVVEPYYD
jgi:DNA/RNA-binding domain of Phe-tRNA-synthetase-like protein